MTIYALIKKHNLQKKETISEMCKTTLLKHKRGGVRLHVHSKGFTLSFFFQVMVYRHWTKTVLIG